MKRFILGFILAISIPVMAAVLWPSGAYLETFQNGFIFGTGKVLSVLNDVITFDDKRLDDRSKKIFFQQDFEGASVSFTCGTNLTAADETTDEIAGTTSKSFTQGATPPTVGVECVSPSFTLDKKQISAFIGFDFYTTYDGNDNEMDFVVYDEDDAEIARVPIRASANKLLHTAYGNTLSTSTELRYEIEVAVQNANAVLILDDIEARVDPVAATDLFNSTPWTSYSPSIVGWGAPTGVAIEYREVGDTVEIRGSLTIGTRTATEFQFPLPNGYTVKTAGNDLEVMGELYWGGGALSANYVFLGTHGDSFLNWGYNQNASGFDNILNGNDLMGDSTFVSFKAKVPVNELSDTAQGVVVKNRTDSASVENVFSAKVSAASPAVVSDENADFIEGDCVRSGTNNSTATCTFKSGLFSVAPNCVANSLYTSGNGASPYDATTTTTTLTVAIQDNTATLKQEGFSVVCQRAGTDYIKETDKVYTVDVANLRGNWVRAEGSSSGAISIGTAISYTEVTDTAGAWDGDEYTVQKNNSKISVYASVGFTGAAGYDIWLYKNGSSYRQIGVDDNNSTLHSGSYISSRGEFALGDILSIRPLSSGGTVSTSTSDNALSIVEEYPDEGVYLGTFGQPTCFYRVNTVGNVSYSSEAGSTSYTQNNINRQEGDCSFSSVASDQIALKAGAYNYRLPVGSNSGTGFVDVRIFDGTTALKEHLDIVYTAAGEDVVPVNEARGQLVLNADTTIRIDTRAANAAGTMYLFDFEFTKVR